MQDEYTNRSANFLIAEYNSITQYILKNQELGETRVNLFVTLASVLGSVVGLLNIPAVQKVIGDNNPEFIAFAILVSMVLFGIVTFKRLVKRTEDIMRYQGELIKIRGYFLKQDPIIDIHSSLYPFDEGYPNTKWKDIVCLQNGSLWVTVGLLNSILIWLLIFTGFTFSLQEGKPNSLTSSVVISSAGALLMWISQFTWRKSKDKRI